MYFKKSLIPFELVFQSQLERSTPFLISWPRVAAILGALSVTAVTGVSENACALIDSLHPISASHSPQPCSSVNRF